MTINNKPLYNHVILGFLASAFIFYQAIADQAALLAVNTSATRPVPKNFYGIFFEDINHAGTGGLWAELVSNRGFEAGGRHSPAMITPWGRVGDEQFISITTELTSCFEQNPVALRMDILCTNNCPPGGVGVYNPGYWGMNIVQGKTYKVVFFAKSTGPLDMVVSFTSADGTKTLASANAVADAAKAQGWARMEFTLEAKASDPQGRLQLTTTKKGTIWLDQVSAMPTDTFKGHGCRTDLAQMLADLRPAFLRFPGGCVVEGEWLMNAIRWKETIGPWEQRPGHFGDVWSYYSDDGLGYLEYLQLCEDLGVEPVWVVNNGIAHRDEVDTTLIAPFVQEMLDGIEFARGSPTSTWGSLRAKYGHPEPFNLKYVAIGNEDCGKVNYRGNYLKFYDALKKAYPDIQAISNCDGSTKQPLDHPTDIYDFHIYTSPQGLIDNTKTFAGKPRNGPKAFVSEYAVTEPRDTIGNGTFQGALAEAAFLLSLETNCDVVEMVSYAPLFMQENDPKWKPDAMIFNSNQIFGISSYWVQTFFADSNGATLLNANFRTNSSAPIFASAISYTDAKDSKNYIKIKVVNYQNEAVNLRVSLEGMDPKGLQGARKTVLSSPDLKAENTFAEPKKIVPVTSPFQSEGANIDAVIGPNTFTAFDILNTGKAPAPGLPPQAQVPGPGGAKQVPPVQNPGQGQVPGQGKPNPIPPVKHHGHAGHGGGHHAGHGGGHHEGGKGHHKGGKVKGAKEEI